MLAVVLLAVLATIQVECAPNQLWPAFDKVSSQPIKKPIFATTIDKETQTKAFNPSATQHAYEQFINTWLRQASLTLNRPDILKLVTSPAASDKEILSQPAVEEVAVTPVVLEEPAAPVRVFPLEGTLSVIAETLASEPEVAPEESGKQLTPVPVEQTSEASPVFAPEQIELSPEIAEVVGDVTPLNEELLIPVAEIIEQTPVPVEAEVVLAVEEVVEPIPSLVEQDTATVLIASPPTPSAEPEILPDIAVEESPEPMVEAQPLELMQPVADAKIVDEQVPKTAEPEPVTGSGKSFSSVKSADNIIAQEPTVAVQQSPQAPIAAFAPRFPVAPVSTVTFPDVVTTDGLAYTLQFFPRRGQSHYFVSTPIGG